MKSIHSESLIQCPSGCEAFEVEHWSFISAQENPELKEALLGGELNLVCCPTCKTFFYCAEPLVYMDTQAEILAFVFAVSEQDKEIELKTKMQVDYQIIKNTLFKQLNIDYPPVCLFGLERLKDLLVLQQEQNFESEVIAAATAAAGLQVARLKPSYAREKGFPYYVPALDKTAAISFAVAAERVLQTGLKSPLLEHFKNVMNTKGEASPIIL